MVACGPVGPLLRGLATASCRHGEGRGGQRWSPALGTSRAGPRHCVQVIHNRSEASPFSANVPPSREPQCDACSLSGPRRRAVFLIPFPFVLSRIW